MSKNFDSSSLSRKIHVPELLSQDSNSVKDGPHKGQIGDIQIDKSKEIPRLVITIIMKDQTLLKRFLLLNWTDKCVKTLRDMGIPVKLGKTLDLADYIDRSVSFVTTNILKDGRRYVNVDQIKIQVPDNDDSDEDANEEIVKNKSKSKTSNKNKNLKDKYDELLSDPDDEDDEDDEDDD